MRKLLYSFLLLIPLLTMFSGCLCDPEYCAMPDLFHPGHISEQQERMRFHSEHISEQQGRMRRFDPFARSDIGPAIDGDRPNGCLTPASTPRYLKEMKDYQNR